MNFLQALWMSPLLFSALLAGMAASVASGIVGSYVVVKRIAFISGSIAHAVLGGIGLSLWLQRTQGIEWFTPMAGALLTAIGSACILSYVRRFAAQREDSAIAALWSLGMAAGVIFISQTPGYNVELTNYLIGNILWVTPTDLAILLALDGAVLLLAVILHKRFLAICFDPTQAELQGEPVHALYLLLLILIAVTVVLLIQVVGILLVMTLLILPPAMANLFTHRLSRMMVVACCLNLLFTFLGMGLAYTMDWPAGGTIALFIATSYIALSLFPRRTSLSAI